MSLGGGVSKRLTMRSSPRPTAAWSLRSPPVIPALTPARSHRPAPARTTVSSPWRRRRRTTPKRPGATTAAASTSGRLASMLFRRPCAAARRRCRARRWRRRTSLASLRCISPAYPRPRPRSRSLHSRRIRWRRARTAKMAAPSSWCTRNCSRSLQ